MKTNKAAARASITHMRSIASRVGYCLSKVEKTCALLTMTQPYATRVNVKDETKDQVNYLKGILAASGTFELTSAKGYKQPRKTCAMAIRFAVYVKIAVKA